MKAKELKRQWHKDIEKDNIREMNMDEIRLRGKGNDSKNNKR